MAEGVARDRWSRAAGRSSCRRSAASRCSASGAPGESTSASSFVCVPRRAQPPARRRAVVDLRVQAASRLRRTGKVFSVVAVDDRAGDPVERARGLGAAAAIEENTHLQEELRERYDFSHIVGTSGPMRQVYEQIAQVARTNTTVLIRGESGTGKELIAHAIHYNSPRAKQAVRQGELRGAPETADRVGAVRLREGRVHRRAGAQEGPLRAGRGRHAVSRRDRRASTCRRRSSCCACCRSASSSASAAPRPVKVNVRLIAATNKRLEKAIAAGAFREDLYYRLNVFTIFVPPLRERKPDILLLADHFLEKYSRRARQAHQAHRDARDRHADELPLAGQRPRARERRSSAPCSSATARRARASSAADAADGRSVGDGHRRCRSRTALAAYEKDMIQDALKSARGNRAKAARLLRRHGAHHQLQGPQVPHRLAPVPLSLYGAALSPPHG